MWILIHVRNVEKFFFCFRTFFFLTEGIIPRKWMRYFNEMLGILFLKRIGLLLIFHKRLMKVLDFGGDSWRTIHSWNVGFPSPKISVPFREFSSKHFKNICSSRILRTLRKFEGEIQEKFKEKIKRILRKKSREF